jgi:predicted DNA-binding ArsR family transcriptional regulator
MKIESVKFIVVLNVELVSIYKNSLSSYLYVRLYKELSTKWLI